MSEIDRYLDALFDRLAGTGAAGRRALAEAEDHLRAAVADSMANGLSRERAEHDAVARFGSPAQIAGQLRHVHRTARPNSAWSGVWLLAGLALVALGLSYLITALSVAVLLRVNPEQVPPCPDPTAGPFDGGCSSSVPAMQGASGTGLVVLLLGMIVLLGRHLAVRSTRLAPIARSFPWLTAALFALAGIALLVGPPLVGAPGTDGLLGVQQGPGLRVSVIASGVALMTSVAATAWGLAQRRT